MTGRRYGIGLAAALLGLVAGSTVPRADPDAFYGDFYGRLQPPLSLPQTLRGTVRVPTAEAGTRAERDGSDAATPRESRAIDTLRDLFPALAACWRAPEGLAGFEHAEITTRFSLRRDGSLIGTPLVTFSTMPSETRARAVLAKATLDAVRRCTPARITPALGGAIAGRPLSLRFVHDGPRGRGV